MPLQHNTKTETGISVRGGHLAVKMMETGLGWVPLRGSWEEAVLSWNEQVEKSFRMRKASTTAQGRKGSNGERARVRTTEEANP